MLRRLTVLLVLPLLLLSTPALADDITLLAGPGARFDAGNDAVNMIGVLHMDWEMVSMLRLAGEVHGFLGGAGVDGIDFADAQIGLMFDAPIPGWFGVELGLSVALMQLLDARHGADRFIGMLKPELALTATAAFFKARLSYQHNVLPFGDTKGVDAGDGQLTLMAGLTF